MNDDRRVTSPGEAANDGQARHGPRSEVSWDGGKGRQPYANQGKQEQDPAAAGEVEAGDRGESSGRNLEQLDAVRGKPGAPGTPSRRDP